MGDAGVVEQGGASGVAPPNSERAPFSQLSEFGPEIDLAVVESIVALGEEAIPPLEGVVDAALALGADVYELPVERTFGLAHAVFCLGRIGGGRALAKIIEVLGQPEDVLEAWLGDLVTEELWLSLRWCGGEHVDELARVLLDDGVAPAARTAVARGLAELAIVEPARRGPIAEVFRSFLQRRIEAAAEPSEAEDALLTDALRCCGRMGASELEPLVDRLFALGRVHELYLQRGDLDLRTRAEPLPARLSEVYRRWRRWAELEEELLCLAADCDDGASGHLELPSHPASVSPAPPWTVAEPIRNQGPKVGRNDPCPCGSGKKFKRCCKDLPTLQRNSGPNDRGANAGGDADHGAACGRCGERLGLTPAE